MEPALGRRPRTKAQADEAARVANDDVRLSSAARRRQPGESWPVGGGFFALLIQLNMMILQTQIVECDSPSFSIIMTQFHVPSPAFVGDSVRLSCQYKLSGETFRALKLFKDDKEFYRYTPAGNQGGGQLQSAPPNPEEDRIIVFPADGVQVDRARSNEREVWLKNVSKKTAGLYKCQVSVESTFKSASATKKLVVIERPKNQQRHALQQQQRQRQKHHQELQQQQQFRGNQMTSMPVSIQLESSQSSSASSPSYSSSYWSLAPLSLLAACILGASLFSRQREPRFSLIEAPVGCRQRR